MNKSQPTARRGGISDLTLKNKTIKRKESLEKLIQPNGSGSFSL